MSNILTIGFICEGPTDKKFFSYIIHRTFESLAFDCPGQIDVYEPEYLPVRAKKFVEQVIEAAKFKDINILCVHADADNQSDEVIFKNKIIPASEKLKQQTGISCKNLVAIVPVQMTEAWMLADKDLLRRIIGSQKSDQELQLETVKLNQIEAISDPKEIIKNTIRLAQIKKRANIDISTLYEPISREIDLKILEQLPSYKKFKNAARTALINLNYLHD